MCYHITARQIFQHLLIETMLDELSKLTMTSILNLMTLTKETEMLKMP